MATATTARNFFSNFSLGRRDRFGPKIVKIGAILAIFRPFEVFGRFSGTGGTGACAHLGPFWGPYSSNRIQMLRFGAVSNSKSSNGRKIARMARNLTIFGPNRSRRRELKFEKFSNERANEQTNELYKKKSNFFSIVFGSFSIVFGGKPERAT